MLTGMRIQKLYHLIRAFFQIRRLHFNVACRLPFHIGPILTAWEKLLNIESLRGSIVLAQVNYGFETVTSGLGQRPTGVINETHLFEMLNAIVFI